MVPGQAQAQPQAPLGPPRLLIEVIRERHKTFVEQLVDPEFIIGKVTCTEALIEKDSDSDSDDYDDWEFKRGEQVGLVKKEGRQSFMYSYKVELLDESGEKITGVLRPGLHGAASEEVFGRGARVRLKDWRVGEAVTRKGRDILFLDLEEFEIIPMPEEEEVEVEYDEMEEEKVGDGEENGINSSYLSSASNRSVTPSTTGTDRELEEQLRLEAGWGPGTQEEALNKFFPTSAQSSQSITKSKLGDSVDGEENYDEGTEYLLALGSFSTPPPAGAQQATLTPESPLPEAGQKSSGDTQSQQGNVPEGKPVSVSALGKRYLDREPKGSQDSISPFSSQSQAPPSAKRVRFISGKNDGFTPTKPNGVSTTTTANTTTNNHHPSLIPNPTSRLNIPPHLKPPPLAPISMSSFTTTSAIPSILRRPLSVWSLLHPTPLASLPSRPHGSKVDILAVIDSIDEHLITRNKSAKRDCRLIDPSSPPLVPPPSDPKLKQPHHNELKPTILSVWVKPQSFNPRPGTLVAFRGLTVHRYAGRSLNAFSDVAGSVWYLENPGNDIEGAEEAGEWWADRCMREVAEEMEREEERARRMGEVNEE